MGKTYYLDLQTLLTYLRNKSGTLTASLVLSGQPCTGIVIVSQGQITFCQIKWPNGKYWEGLEALQHLQPVKEWQVDFNESPSSLKPLTASQPVIRPSSPNMPIQSMPVPRPKSPLYSASLHNYNAQQRIMLRMVHAMVDGQRTTEQIKAQLKLPPDAVDVALVTLRTLGTIE